MDMGSVHSLRIYLCVFSSFDNRTTLNVPLQQTNAADTADVFDVIKYRCDVLFRLRKYARKRAIPYPHLER